MRYALFANVVTLTIGVFAVVEDAKSMAADADMSFFLAFLDDFNERYTEYTSYMIREHHTLPQEVANYYYHLNGVDEYDLKSDIINQFPFTIFKSFITVFPWYSSLLSEGGITDMVLPGDFLSTPTLDLYTSTTDAPTVSLLTSVVSSVTLSNKDITKAAKAAASTYLVSNYMWILLLCIIFDLIGFLTL